MPGVKTHRHRVPSWRAALVLALVAVGLTATTAAPAANLGVTPLRIELSAGQRIRGVQVSNLDPERAVSVQARLFRWQQVDGQDVYTDADGITLSPPITRIEPGRENLIRLVMSGAPPTQGEASYRLFLDELPEPQVAGQTGVSLMIRQTLPVFVASSNMRPAEPEWQVERVNPGGDGSPSGYRVTVRNLGDRRLRLSELSLANEEGAVLAQRLGLVGYVLGQSRMSFVIADVEERTAAAAAVMLKARNETEEFSIGPLPVRPGA